MNRIIIKTILCLISFVTYHSSIAETNTLNGAQKLTRIRRVIEGRDPEKHDLEYARRLQGEQLQIFLHRKASEYTKSSGFTDFMLDEMHKLFRLEYALAQPRREFVTNTSIGQLFRKIAHQNLPWNYLLLAKSYEFDVYSTQNSFEVISAMQPRSDEQGQDYNWLERFYREDGFYGETGERKIQPVSHLNRNLPEALLSPHKQEVLSNIQAHSVTPKPGEENLFAGAITTPRFFDRYKTSEQNRNRGRAAAVLRIFLCNDMMPSVDITDKVHAEILMKNALSADFDVKQSYGSKANAGDQHDAEPACQNCHKFLEPIARMFMGSGINLSSYPMPGELVMSRGGHLVRYPVTGLGELGAIIVQQPEYAECQVQHFWNWFVGKNISITDSRKQELVKVFHQLGHRPQNFVAYLVTQEEFYKAHTQRQLTEAQLAIFTARNTFQRCDKCHEQDFEAPTYKLANLPWSSNKHLIAEAVITALNLRENQPNGPSMPPRLSAWKLLENDRRLIKIWFKLGAPIEHGERLFNEQEAKQLQLGVIQ